MRPKTYVLGVWQDSKRVSNALSPWNGVCLEAIASPNFSGKRGETTIIGSVLFVGLGKKGGAQT